MGKNIKKVVDFIVNHGGVHNIFVICGTKNVKKVLSVLDHGFKITRLANIPDEDSLYFAEKNHLNSMVYNESIDFDSLEKLSINDAEELAKNVFFFAD